MVPRNEVVPQFSGLRQSTFPKPSLLRKRVEQAWRLRWGSSFSCTAARAVAASLLELSGARGADGACPASHEVERDFRHAGLDP